MPTTWILSLTFYYISLSHPSKHLCIHPFLETFQNKLQISTFSSKYFNIYIINSFWFKFFVTMKHLQNSKVKKYMLTNLTLVLTSTSNHFHFSLISDLAFLCFFFIKKASIYAHIFFFLSLLKVECYTYSLTPLFIPSPMDVKWIVSNIQVL